MAEKKEAVCKAVETLMDKLRLPGARKDESSMFLSMIDHFKTFGQMVKFIKIAKLKTGDGFVIFPNDDILERIKVFKVKYNALTEGKRDEIEDHLNAYVMATCTDFAGLRTNVKDEKPADPAPRPLSAEAPFGGRRKSRRRARKSKKMRRRRSRRTLKK